MNWPDQVKLFGMNNLLLEEELLKLENNGIEIFHTRTVQKDQVVDADLFESDIRQQAIKMGNFYELYYCIENTIRRLISETLRNKYGANWWTEKVPESIRQEVEKKQEREKNSVMSLRSEDPLSYTSFGELIPIFETNWNDFSDTFRSQKAVTQILSQLNQLRNVIAHSCELNDDEIIRFKLLMKDWLRMQT